MYNLEPIGVMEVVTFSICIELFHNNVGGQVTKIRQNFHQHLGGIVLYGHMINTYTYIGT
ncbi:hypothetical protein [Inconstantimicrobium mannanitabidum]|uniref:Uncharacterized protein n=1 Tax=Inconstantimicrobium mannanitabidum TaxID=1604901 RepID=A0ACB5RE75_9CLOT|nr:hypothetical protein [Clostridium sp. TW13]GKX67567.1 hypothetical protein rsdtw13_28250 [Clostridium sp. TW13]